MKERRDYGAVIAFLFLLSFLLRVHNWFHFKVPDEATIAAWVKDLFTTPFPVNSYPPFFLYLLYAVVWLVAMVAEWLGIVTHAAQLVTQSGGVMVIQKTGQILSALIGSLQVLVVWRIGRDFFSRNTGLISALLIAVNPLLILDSHINKSDILLSMLAGMVLYFTFRFDRGEKATDIFYAAFFVGLATAAKYQGILLVGSSLLLLFKYPIRREALRLFKLGLLILSGVVLGFLAGSPNWLVHPLEQCREGYRIIFYHYVEFNMHGYDSATVSFHQYFVDFCRSFGVWIMLAAAAFLLFWWKGFRREKAILFTPVLIYIGLLGSRPIYAHRFGLPLYTHLAVLSALALSVFFFELFPKLKLLPLWRHGAALILAALGLFYLVRMADFSWQRFELLRTSGTLDRAVLFRRNHFPPQTHFIRETMTPLFPGDVGFWDIGSVPVWRFRGSQAIPFVSTGLLSKYIMTEASNLSCRSAVLDRLNGYLLFHRVEKARFGPWDDDVCFWYRTNLVNVRRPAGRGIARMPVLYAGMTDPRAAYYPLGPYEQNPGWVKLKDVRKGFLLESRLPVTAFRLKVFRASRAEGSAFEFQARVNGCESTYRIHRGGWEKELAVGNEKATVFGDYRYELDFYSSPGPVWVSFSPVYGGGKDKAEPLLLPLGAVDVPDYSSTGGYSDDLKRFYFENGLDLTLLKSLNTRTILDNVTLSQEVSIEPFLLDRGQYQLEFVFESFPRDDSADFSLSVEVKRIGKSGEQNSMQWLHAASRFIALEVEEETALCMVRIPSTCSMNCTVRRVILRPDYPSFLEKERRKRNP